MDNRDKIIEKQDELIKHLDCLCRIHGYIPGQPQTTSERLIAELSLLREPKNGIEPRQSTECEPDQKVMSVEVKCPACESEDIFTVIQRHHKCRGCGIRFCTDMDGNRRNYAILDEAMESHVSAGKNVTNKPTDEENLQILISRLKNER